MFEILIEVESAAVPCPAVPPMKPGLGFVVRDEKLYPRGAAPICLLALQSMMPFLTAKQREIAADDWMARVHHSQCPHPEHRVTWRLEQRPVGATRWLGADVRWQSQDVAVEVESIRALCTSGTAIGDAAMVRSGLLYLPQPMCLWAVQAALPAMAERTAPCCFEVEGGCRVRSSTTLVCPDPAGSVILRIEERD